MKSNKFTYILIVCVGALWALVFYRIYAAVADREPVPLIASAQKVTLFDLVNHEHDTLLLDLDYRNPFGVWSDNVTREIDQVDRLNPIEMVKQNVAIKTIMKWPEIAFLGSVINTKNRAKVAIIMVAGKELMLSEGQGSGGIKMLEFAGDSVRVSFLNETKYIKLK